MTQIFSEMSKEQERKLLLHELGVTKQLISERKHPLDIVREFLSNSMAREVGSRSITVTYAVNPDYGHSFTIQDDGCGMDYTGSLSAPGRLDRFLSLGYSGVIGFRADEFSWKGLGSKLSFQSRRVDVETWNGGETAYRVVINEPWETINRGEIPRAKISEFKADSQTRRGTRISIQGHPPFPDDKVYSLDEIRDYLLHRTVVGFTRIRENPPKLELRTPGGSISLIVGFPVLKRLDELQGSPVQDTVVVNEQFETAVPGTNRSIRVAIKGFYTLDGSRFGLIKGGYNTGLILSVQGIPYFSLNLAEYAGRGGLVISPGEGNCSLVVECDALQEEMNISRSDLNDSAVTRTFKTRLQRWFETYQTGETYQKFRQYARMRKKEETHEKGAVRLGETKDRLMSASQSWVWLVGTPPTRLHRVPENEYDTLAILWKLEPQKKLPFYNFETLAHQGQGCDLVVNLQEDRLSEPERVVSVEVENLFTNYRLHGHHPPQMPTIICWDIGQNPKTRIRQTDKPFKFTSEVGDVQLRIFTIKRMDCIRIDTVRSG